MEKYIRKLLGFRSVIDRLHVKVQKLGTDETYHESINT